MMFKKVVSSIALLLLIVSIAFSQEVVFSASASSNKIGINDQVQVSYTIKNVSSLGDFTPPRVTDFRVVQGPIQSYQNINGASSASIIYILQPIRKGVLTIPAAKATIGNRSFQSNTLQIQVVDGSLAVRRQQRNSNDPFAGMDDDPFAGMDASMHQMMKQQQAMIEAMQRRQQALMEQYRSQQGGAMQSISPQDLNKYLYIKAIVDNPHPYLGQQINVSYKVYARVNLNIISGAITDMPSLNGFWSEDYQLPQPMRPSIEYINGVPFAVTLIKKTALFPQQTGQLELDPATATCEFPSGTYKVSSPIVSINVKPLPTAGQPISYTGAVGNFTVTSNLDSNNLTTDDVGTYTITISGSGNIKLIDNPKINFPVELGVLDPIITDTITSRSPTIIGKKIFTYNFNPQRPGDYTIPSMEFSYFDAATGAYKTTQTSSYKIHIKEGLHYKDNFAKNNVLGDIAGIKTQTLSSSSTTTPIIQKAWYWSMYGLPVLAFIGLLAYRRKQEDYVLNADYYKTKKANKVAWKRLATARKLMPNSSNKDFYEEISKAIWLYLSDKLKIPIGALSKDNIDTVLQQKLVNPNLISQTQQLFSDCEMALYSPAGNQRQRADMLQQTGDIIDQYETILK